MNGVREVRIGDVAEVLRGVTYKKPQATKAPRPECIPLLRATNIDRELSFVDLYYIPEELVKPEQLLRRGDTVVAASSGSLAVVGKAATLRTDWVGTFGAFCFAVRPNTAEIASLYLAYYMQTTEYRSYVSNLAAGVNINNLKRKDVERMKIPLPSLAEQERIVHAIETYTTRLDSAEKTLARTTRSCHQLRQAVLKSAYNGSLLEKSHRRGVPEPGIAESEEGGL